MAGNNGPLSTASPKVITILIWISWVILILPSFCLIFIQRRRLPKQKGSFWSAFLYAIVMLGTLGMVLTFMSAFSGGRDVRNYMIIEWSSNTRHYLYIHHSLGTYILFVIQLIGIQHLQVHVAKHKDSVMNVTAQHPQGAGSWLTVAMTVLYILCYALTLAGFIASVCLDIWYCREPNWRTTIQDPIKCPVWWSWVPWLALSLIHLISWVCLLGATYLAYKKFSRGKSKAELKREPRQLPLLLAVCFGSIAITLEVVRLVVGGAVIGKEEHIATYASWNSVGFDLALLSFEVLILGFVVFVAELRKGFGKGERATHNIEMYNIVPNTSGGVAQPPPVYAQQQQGGGPPVYTMPPPRYA